MPQGRQIKTVSFADHERDLLASVERRGPFSPYVKRLLRQPAVQIQNSCT